MGGSVRREIETGSRTAYPTHGRPLMTDLFGAISLFVRVARTGSFSQAGREQGLSQPTVSRAIAALERDIGVSLFTRTPRAVVLTEAGADYFGRVESILGALDEATHIVRGTGELRGTLRLGLSSNFGLREIIPRLPRFLEKHPELNITMLFDDERQDLVTQGIDVAFRFGQLSDSTAVARRICSCTRVAVASPGYLSRMTVPNVPADLASHSLVAGPATPTPTLSFHQDGRMVSVRIPSRITATLTEATVTSAAMGLGIAVVPLSACMNELASGLLVRVLPDWQLPDVEVNAVYPAGRAAKPAARSIIDFIVGEIGHQDPYPLSIPQCGQPTKEDLMAALKRVGSDHLVRSAASCR